MAEQTLPSKSETPQITTATTQTPDGRWQSTLNISFQITTTWGPSDDSSLTATQRKTSEGDTDTGGTTKTGLGVRKKFTDRDLEK